MDTEEILQEEHRPKKKKKRFYKRFWFWALVAVAAIIIFSALSGNEPSDLIDMPEDEYRAACQTYTYDEIARHPDKYEKSLAKFTGEVAQVIKNGDEIQLRVNVTYGEYYYTDTVYVFYEIKNGTNILEDDIITMYGELRGLQTYETVFGQQISIPRIYAKYIDIEK